MIFERLPAFSLTTANRAVLTGALLLICTGIATGCTDEAPSAEPAPSDEGNPGSFFVGWVTSSIPVHVVTDETSANGTLMVVVDGEAIRPELRGTRPQVYNEASTGLDAEPLYRRSLAEVYESTQRWVATSYSFGPPERFAHVFFDHAGSCNESCTMRFYFSQEPIADVTDRALFWEESPERWRYAELQFRWDEVVGNTFLVNYDEITADLEMSLGTVVVDTTGGGLSVSIEPRVHSMHDYSHPRYVAAPDVDSDVMGSSAGDVGDDGW